MLGVWLRGLIASLGRRDGGWLLLYEVPDRFLLEPARSMVPQLEVLMSSVHIGQVGEINRLEGKFAVGSSYMKIRRVSSDGVPV